MCHALEPSPNSRTTHSESFQGQLVSCLLCAAQNQGISAMRSCRVVTRGLATPHLTSTAAPHSRTHVLACVCVCCVVTHAAGDKLVMAGLPAAGVQYAVGDDSDDPDAADAGDTAAPDMGQVRNPCVTWWGAVGVQVGLGGAMGLDSTNVVCCG